jgi:ATPase family associated with various cellular activities (AAA)
MQSVAGDAQEAAPSPTSSTASSDFTHQHSGARRDVTATTRLSIRLAFPRVMAHTHATGRDRSGARTILSHPGSIFANFMLADEINRVPAKEAGYQLISGVAALAG